MKPYHIQEIIKRLEVSKYYDSDIPVTVLENELANYVGLDKYRIKYTLETIVRLGYFSFTGLNMVRINKKNNGEKSGDK